MITQHIGRYTVTYEPLLAHATVTIQGLLLADGLDAAVNCLAWVKSQADYPAAETVA